MADPMGAEIVVEQDAAKTPESGGEAQTSQQAVLIDKALTDN
ncbi:hypothetical protein BFJ66_g16774 [Fusarium oxysporum f. sp. cepae]|nr:hypothetical protein BFJ66_g16774 [Fusarium oxysporum f. sp. cepae]